VAKIARIPCILTYHGTYVLAKRDLGGGIRQLFFILENVIMRIPWDAIVCVDYFSLGFLQHHFRTRSQRLYVIPSGVDAEQFHSMPVKESTHRTGVYTILCPRRIDPKNGIEYLIRASIECKPNIQSLVLLIAGRTNAGMEDHARLLHDLVRTGNSDSYVRFLGDVEHDKMPELYNSADIVVIPSLAEARSLSALEAMACEKPIIATRVGGLPEIVKENFNGILVNPGDVGDLVRAIYRLHDGPELSHELGRNARTIALENDWTNRAHDYENLYEEVISHQLK
jgi:glycosyltransferase involved in cell wall biosynthesis